MMLVNGEPGTGKTYCVLTDRAQSGEDDSYIPYIRANRLMTARTFLEQLVAELGEIPAWKSMELFNQAKRLLTERPRPFIVDELDYALRPGSAWVEVIRDVCDETNAPAILVGMASIDKKLQRFPHFYDRILVRVEFQLFNREDIREMAEQICEVGVDDSALSLIQKRSCGKLRRILAEFYKAEVKAKASGIKTVTASHLQNGGDRE